MTRALFAAAAAIGVAAWLPLGAEAAWAAPFAAPPLYSSPSDPRAEYHSGNVTTCAAVTGVPDDDLQLGAPEDEEAHDDYVKATTSGGKYVNVAITAAGQAAGVVIDAVVIKGGDGYNVYRDPYVPPQLQPPQNYISPLNNGGMIPDLSHWFVCYHLEPQPGTTTPPALVGKVVIPPPGEPAQPLPTTFTLTVSCTGMDPFDLTFGSGGGSALFGQDKMKDVPPGTVCTVKEKGTPPDGSTVHYVPASAATTGVTIGTVPVIVFAVNDFSDVPVKTTDLTITKVVDAPAGMKVPGSFQIGVVCKDGDGDFTGEVNGKLTPQLATVPAGGSLTVTDITVGAQCAVAENAAALGNGWNVSYAVAGQQASAAYPIFNVEDDGTRVMIINTYSPILPMTGEPTLKWLPWAAAFIALGIGTVSLSVRIGRPRA